MSDWGVEDDHWANPLASDFAQPTQASEPDDDPDAEPGGLSDPTGTVTGWFADGALVRVTVSNRWQQASEVPLDRRLHAVCQRFQMENIAAGGPQVTPSGARMADEDRWDPAGLLTPDYLGVERVGVLSEELVELLNRLDAYEADPEPPQSEFTPAVGTSDNQKIRVTVGPGHLPTDFRVDAEWAAGARTEKLMDAIDQALKRAYAAWQPPAEVPGSAAELSRRASDLNRRTMQVMGLAPGAERVHQRVAQPTFQQAKAKGER